ncbi:MAG: hypothetical protein VR64_01410 [Desulfatitalea sp. BRH_c12]|nr:MAG: hypothetical protein VR64_01410 [Desulfatitalea sp. BRH_c12]
MQTAEDILQGKPNRRMVSIDADQSVAAAVQKMIDANIGAILIENKGDLIGIWTERDLLHLVGRSESDPRNSRIGDHMASPLHCAAHDTPVEQLEEMFLGLFIRHILIRKQNSYIGLLSIGDALRASLLEKDRRIKKLNSIASWQYYENWGWDRKK